MKQMTAERLTAMPLNYTYKIRCTFEYIMNK